MFDRSEEKIRGFLQRTTFGRPEGRKSATQPRSSRLWQWLKPWLISHTTCTAETSSSSRTMCHLLTSDRLNSRLRQLSLKLQQWLLKIEYVKGVENGAADALSRQEVLNETASPGRQSGGGGGGCGGVAPRIEHGGNP